MNAWRHAGGLEFKQYKYIIGVRASAGEEDQAWCQMAAFWVPRHAAANLKIERVLNPFHVQRLRAALEEVSKPQIAFKRKAPLDERAGLFDDI